MVKYDVIQPEKIQATKTERVLIRASISFRTGKPYKREEVESIIKNEDFARTIAGYSLDFVEQILKDFDIPNKEEILAKAIENEIRIAIVNYSSDASQTNLKKLQGFRTEPMFAEVLANAVDPIFFKVVKDLGIQNDLLMERHKYLMREREVEGKLANCLSTSINEGQHAQSKGVQWPDPQKINELQELIKDPIFLEKFIYKTTAYGFRTVLNFLDIENKDEIIKEREDWEREVLANCQDYPVELVKEAMSDLYFKNSSINVGHNIRTVVEYLKYNKDKLGVSDSTIDAILTFTTLNGNSSIEEMRDVINLLEQTNAELAKAQTNLEEFVGDLFNNVKIEFANDLSKNITEVDTLLSGIQSEDVISKDGKPVKFYKLQNQTANQRGFYLLIRTDGANKLTEKGAMQKYKDKSSSLEYSSYSVISTEHDGRFSKSDSSITLGFSNPGDANLLSANVLDGDTNAFRVVPGRYNLGQNFFSMQEFMDRAEGHNEVIYEHPEKILPTMIVARAEQPSENEISAAAEMGLPIVYIDRACYKSKDKSKEGSIGRWSRQYNYSVVEKELPTIAVPKDKQRVRVKSQSLENVILENTKEDVNYIKPNKEPVVMNS